MTDYRTLCVEAQGSKRRKKNRATPKFLLWLAACTASPLLPAESLTLRWAASPSDVDIAGYLVHIGTSSGKYEWVLDAASEGRWTDRIHVDGLDNDRVYYVAVQSRNKDYTRYSALSNEISVTPGNAPGADPATFAFESGSIEAGPNWRWISFNESFEDPIVIATPNKAANDARVLVRIDGIEPDGFWIRLQGWCDLEGQQGPTAPVAYFATERGRRQLANGSWIEAGRLTTDATGTYVRRQFLQAFPSKPVVLANVTSAQDSDAVFVRLHNIDRTGFMVGMTEPEAAHQYHLAEAIDYIAWEAGSGALDGFDYEVGATGNTVDHATHRLRFDTTYWEPPSVLLSAQTNHGFDPTTVLVKDKSRWRADIQLLEEHCLDSENWHVTEDVGYLIIEGR